MPYAHSDANTNTATSTHDTPHDGQCQGKDTNIILKYATNSDDKASTGNRTQAIGTRAAKPLAVALVFTRVHWVICACATQHNSGGGGGEGGKE